MVEILLYQQLLLVNPMTKYFCLSIHLPIFFFSQIYEYCGVCVFLIGNLDLHYVPAALNHRDLKCVGTIKISFPKLISLMWTLHF